VASHWFRISFADKAFLRFIAARGFTIDSLGAADAVAAMLDFYAEHRAQHTDLSAGGDSLTLTVNRRRTELTRAMTRSDDELQSRRLVLAFDTASGSKPHGVTCTTPEEAQLLLAHLREESFVESVLAVHFRVE
jgi:hypothetical protein